MSVYDETTETVSEILNNAIQTSDSMKNKIDVVMANMSNALGNLSIDALIDLPELPEIEIPDINLDLTDLEYDPDVSTPDIPTTPTLVDVDSIDVAIPENSNVNFNVTIPEAPDISMSTSAPTSPGMKTISIPAMPDYELPSVPSLDDIVLPQAPTIDIPEFTAVAPDVSAENLPDIPAFSYNEEQYQSDLSVAILQKLLDDIADGGSGLNPDVEQAIYDRMLARQRAENERLYRETEDQLSATGFDLPTGALASRLLEIAAEISRKNDQASWEIMIKQAELAQTNTHFTVEKSIAMEQVFRDFFEKQEARRLEAARQTALIAVEIFKALVNKIEVALEIYKTEAMVFTERLKAKLAEVDIYRAQIDGTRAAVDVQNARVALYNSQLSGVEALMGIYQTQMESAKIQMEMEVAKMQGYRAEIEAYVAMVDVQRIRIDAFRSQVEGARAQVELAMAQVNKYNAEVAAAKLNVEAQSVAVNAQLEKNRGAVEVYKSQVEAAKMEADLNVSIASIGLEVFKGKVQQNIAQADAVLKEAELNGTRIDAEAKIYVAQAGAYVEQMKAAISGYLTLKDILINGYVSQITGYSNISASALNAISANASLRTDAGWNHSENTSDQFSISHNHSYYPDADSY